MTKLTGTVVPIFAILVRVSHNARLSDYRTALTAPGSRGPVLSSLMARLPVAMVGFSVLLYVQRTTGSFATAGLVAAGLLFGVSLGSVTQGRIIDWLGPTRPILVVTALFTAAITALVIAIEGHAATPILLALATASGITEPMISSASRTLWSRLLPDGPARQAAYAYEAISMEVFFILGPGLAGIMIATPWAGSGVIVGAACMIVGSCIFALSPAVRAWGPRTRSTTARPLLGALVSPGMRTLVVASLGFGVVIGFVEVAVPAAATAAGRPTIGGLLLSVWSLSSVVFGMLYSMRPWPRAVRLRMPVLLAGFGVAVGLLALPTALVPSSMLVLACAMVLAGALITPQATTHSSIIELVAPPGTATEAFGWVITSVTLGLAAGQSISGQIVEAFGPPLSFLGATLCSGILAAIVYARRGTIGSAVLPEVVELRADAVLGGGPEHGVDIGVHQLDDLANAGVRP